MDSVGQPGTIEGQDIWAPRWAQVGLEGFIFDVWILMILRDTVLYIYIYIYIYTCIFLIYTHVENS